MTTLMTAQKVATGVAVGALSGLFLWVGVPALLPPQHVPEIEIAVPVAEVGEGSPGDEVASADPAPPASDRSDDDDADDGGSGDDGPGDDGPGDDDGAAGGADDDRADDGGDDADSGTDGADDEDDADGAADDDDGDDEGDDD